MDLLYQLNNDKNSTSGRCAGAWVGVGIRERRVGVHGIGGLEHLGNYLGGERLRV